MTRLNPLRLLLIGLCACCAVVCLTGAQCKHDKTVKLRFYQTPQSLPGEAAGQSFTFNLQVVNIGNKSSGGYSVKAWLSNDGTFNAASITQIGTSTVQPSIAKGGLATVTVSAQVPVLYPAGEWFIFVEIPGQTSTLMRFPVLVSTTTPDFTVVGLGLSKTLIQRGTSVTAEWNLANLGSGTGTVRNGFFLGLNPTHTGGDQYLGLDVAPNYSPGSSNEADTNITIPGSTPPGLYYILFVANYDGAITEVDNFNNSIAIPIFVTTNTGIDYVMGNQDLGDPLVVGQGTSFTVTQQAANAGTLDAVTGVEIGAYLMHSQTNASPGGLLVGATGTNLLLAGTTQTVSFNVIIPPNLAPGTYYLGYYIDDLNFQPESNESNNATATIPITVVADDSLENNDTQATASLLTKATLYSNLLSLQNDEDWYRVTVGGFTNQVTSTLVNTTPGEVTCSVYDGLGTLLGNGGATGTGWADTLTQLRPGNYYFRVLHTNVNTLSTTYSLRIDSIEQSAALVNTSGTINVNETLGNNDTFSVALSRQPNAGETVSLTLSFNAAQINVSPTVLNFTNGNYTTPQVVTVSAVNDGLPEGAQTYQIHPVFSTTDGASDYNAALAADVPVHVTD